ncbi:AraC family transcriptional regulator [Inconstantimicrobium mannanitabidum]|uniref:AraC family transcriptional regulator n=1 Tax=Inconstantimicrobium mannanitabidum TaxID=1604901 RepID=A0ACB5R6I4_9CLOT|nr:helix-turn-helix domain-containing protein [Clostridium sp. TW13]GKX64792.1 AraC family transcriptional regulator [Clostridium sp. TW13]
MCNVGISIDKFNPEILFAFKVDNKDYINTTYHCHDFIEFSYVVSGSVTYRINDKYYKIKEKTLLPFNPNVYHKESLNVGETATELHIGFRNLQIEGLPINTVISEHFEGPLEFKQFREDFHKCCLEIIEEQTACEVGHELILKSLIMKLIALFLKETNYVQNKKKINRCEFSFYDKSNIVEIILKYFDENYMDNISLDNIAKNMYLSSVYISKIFKDKTGESPINYLINLRLEKAKDLLASTELPIKAVAQSVGYKDAYYFSKLFKKYSCYSPSKYRSINS